MKDSKLLHFLKNFPAWIVLLALLLVFVALYAASGDGSFKEWSSLVLASLFTALGVQRFQSNQTGNTTSGDVVIAPEPTENKAETLNLTDAEINSAVENIKEEK